MNCSRSSPAYSPSVPIVTPTEASVTATFDDAVLPHLDAGRRLARWLVGNEHDAEDAVQEASLRAFRYFRTFSGQNARGWFLRIVRNVCWGSRSSKAQVPTDLFDEERHNNEGWTPDPETLLLRAADASRIEGAITDLPDRARALLVLREFEGLSYQELSDALEIPLGTVMSGLSRARQAFRKAWDDQLQATVVLKEGM
jgi:RNA polymerase sigma-70 factor, ECF subfamily